jgi:putative transposase
MPVKRPQLFNNEIYHLVLRGVGDDDIFKRADDYWRAIFSLYEFNTTEPIEIRIQRKKRKRAKNGEQFSDIRELLIDVLAFCFMPNHIHLLVRQKIENGITQFMRKFGAGYAAYFNKKYNRRGHLFQGRFRAVHIQSNRQLKTIFVYIHTNPISLIDFEWKENGTGNTQKALDFLEDYKWSSFPDYIGGQNFPSITEREFLIDVFGGKKKCKEIVLDWINGKRIYFRDVELE